MHETYTLLQKIRQLLAIFFPILITQVLMFAMNFFDTLMSGQASPYDLAGVAVGSSLWLPVNTGLGGIFMAITPIVAQLLGAKLKEKISFTVIQGLYLALIISGLLILMGVFLLEPILSLLKLEDSVRTIAGRYIGALAFGIPPLFVYFVLRAFMDALGQTKVTMFITLTSLPINLVLNYTLIFGKFGFPALGGVGAGIASAITYYWLVFLALGFVFWHGSFSTYEIFNRFPAPSFRAWKEQLIVGIPIAFAIFFETSIFAVVTLLMSSFGTYIIAAHQAAMNFASLLYMLPLSISMALTIVVGFEAGSKRLKDACYYSYLGIGISLSMAVLSAIILVIFKEQIAGLYSQKVVLIKLTQQFLIFALFFQLSDAIAAPIQGILRGYKDVNATLLLALISYWVIALPLGYYLATFSFYGAKGYWIGLIIGLALNAISLLIRLLIVQRRHAKLAKNKLIT